MAAFAWGLGLSSYFGEKRLTRAHASVRPRVVSVHTPDATSWNHSSDYHWDTIDQTVVNDMVAAGIKALTGKKDSADGWAQLVPHQTGQAVAIKVNFNNSWSCSSSNIMDAYPETVNAVIDGLMSIGIPANRIWIAEPSRVFPNRFIDQIRQPEVQFFSVFPSCSPKISATDYVSENSNDASSTTYPTGNYIRPAQVFVDADHLINIALVKGHDGAGVTLSLKNHFGSITFAGSDPDQARQQMHSWLYPGANPDPNKTILGDINNNPHIRGKTRLVIGDGLFGNPFDNTSEPVRWRIFDNKDPNILFFATDPVALDSVICDYINEERSQNGYSKATTGYLSHANAMGLGIHDHWLSYETKLYSLIDYLPIEGTDYEPDNNGNGGSASSRSLAPLIDLLLSD
jgi:uncharacterized protein (DUF362 family)